jgi:hypothetical protein
MIGVLVSIISLLADPNCSSPANVDAGVAYRKNRDLFDSVVKSKSTNRIHYIYIYILIVIYRTSRRIEKGYPIWLQDATVGIRLYANCTTRNGRR